MTISRAEYKRLQEQAQVITSLTLQNEWLLEQLKLSKKKLFGRSSEQAGQMVMDQGYLKSDVGFFCFRVFEKGGCSKVLCGVFSFRDVRGKAVAVKFFVGFRRRM